MLPPGRKRRNAITFPAIGRYRNTSRKRSGRTRREYSCQSRRTVARQPSPFLRPVRGGTVPAPATRGAAGDGPDGEPLPGVAAGSCTVVMITSAHHDVSAKVSGNAPTLSAVVHPRLNG